jgi:hypothetical protein
MSGSWRHTASRSCHPCAGHRPAAAAEAGHHRPSGSSGRTRARPGRRRATGTAEMPPPPRPSTSAGTVARRRTGRWCQRLARHGTRCPKIRCATSCWATCPWGPRARRRLPALATARGRHPTSAGLPSLLATPHDDPDRRQRRASLRAHSRPGRRLRGRCHPPPPPPPLLVLCGCRGLPGSRRRRRCDSRRGAREEGGRTWWLRGLPGTKQRRPHRRPPHNPVPPGRSGE